MWSMPLSTHADLDALFYGVSKKFLRNFSKTYTTITRYLSLSLFCSSPFFCLHSFLSLPLSSPPIFYENVQVKLRTRKLPITNKNNSIMSFPLLFDFNFPSVNTSCWHLTDHHALFYGIHRNFWKHKYNFIARVHMTYVWHIIEVKFFNFLWAS